VRLRKLYTRIPQCAQPRPRNSTVPYPYGAFGWLSYDVARELESLPLTTPDDGLPRLQLGVFDRVAAWKEPHDGAVELRVTACPVTGDTASDARQAYETGIERATGLVEAALHNHY